jgi:hypothetical protein
MITIIIFPLRTSIDSFSDIIEVPEIISNHHISITFSKKNSNDGCNGKNMSLYSLSPSSRIEEFTEKMPNERY